MRHARIFSICVFAVVLVYGAVGFYYLPLATFNGDLTRMGLLPEKLFGWTKPRPALDPKWMQQSSMQQADVLVIGDSFSEVRVWQTVLTQSGLKVRTESWKNINGVCADIVPWLRVQGFTGKYLVIESVERLLADRFGNRVTCKHQRYHPSYTKIDESPRPPPVSVNVNRRNYASKLSVGIQTRLNMLKYEILSQATDFKSWVLSSNTPGHVKNNVKVKVARVADGCVLFSHARCDDALFITTDQPDEVGEDILNNIEILNSRLNGVTPIWVFVPNKSTAYLYPDKQFWNKAEQRFKAPNLLRMTQQAIHKKTVDLYPANNTHLSTTGYLLMGEEILKAIQQSQRLGHAP